MVYESIINENTNTCINICIYVSSNLHFGALPQKSYIINIKTIKLR